MTLQRFGCLAAALVLSWGSACGTGADAKIPPHPGVESLGLSESERAAYAPISFDNLISALAIAEEDPDAVETVIGRVNRKTVGWSGVVKSTRVIKPGIEVSEFSLNVASPSEASAFVPKTVPVLFTAPNDDPISKIAKGTPVVFVGRLEFDGFSREPWVLDARLVE